MLFDACVVEEIIDSAARNLAAATRDTGASAEVQGLVIQTARVLRDDLLQMLSRIAQGFDAERRKLDLDMRRIGEASERIMVEQHQLVEERKSLDDEMLKQFITRPAPSIQAETRHLVELKLEKNQLANARSELVEDRRQLALTISRISVERTQLAEQARDLELERQYLLEWNDRAKQHILESRTRSMQEVRLLEDTRHTMNEDLQRLAQDANQLVMYRNQMDVELRYRGLNLQRLQCGDRCIGDPVTSPCQLAPSQFKPARQPSLEMHGRLDELYMDAKTWQC